jgi:hypothetical protein
VTVPGAVPLATEAQVRRLAQQWLRKPGNGQVLAVQARPQWAGASTLDVDGRIVRVVPCPSPLAMRAALVDAAPDERLVVLTDCDPDALGTGLLSHCARLKVFSIEPWDLVRSEFNVADLDPALVKEGHWLAEALTEQAQAPGWPPVTGTVLTRDHALRSLTAGLLGVAAGDLDSAGILQWSTRSLDVVRYAALPAELRRGVGNWLAETAGPAARWVMACADAGDGTDAIPLGLLAALLWAEPGSASSTLTAARVRMEALIGGVQPSVADATSWGEAAQAWVERAVDGSDHQLVARTLGRAEEIARGIHAEKLLVKSDLLPAALTARLHAFADALRAALPAPSSSTLGGAEVALRGLRRHRLAAIGGRIGLAEMAVRLLRWLAKPEAPAPTTLAAAVARQATEDGWVDRARLDIWAGDPDPYLATAYRMLHSAVDSRRAAHDEQFAALLAQNTAADSAPGPMLRVEDVRDHVVRPILDAGRHLLLLVVDGMSVAASTELVASATEAGWIELTPAGGPRVGVLAALPTVTQVGRASLFAGRITVGQQAEERAALAAAFGPRARLLHKADLRAGPGASLDPEVIAVLDDPSVPLVAAVVNTIDDALDRSDPGVAEWGLQTVRAVRDLLEHAKDRVVVLLSDHGHVVDRGEEMRLRSHPSGGARWRAADSPAGEGELLFAGPRVALGGGRVVLPWRETLRYAPRKAGYHGGASAAEAVIPLTILTARDDSAVPGWAGAPIAAMSWWRGPVAGEVAIAPAEDTLFEFVTAPPSAPPAPAGAPPLVTSLLASDVYQARRKLAGRTALPDERVSVLLTVLVHAGGRARLDSLAADAGIPAHRIGLTVTALRRLLQVEGYPVLDIDPDGQTLVLDERLLRDQFQLGS